jgi:hypothetical protein
MPTISKQDIIQNQNFLPCFKCYCKSHTFSHSLSWHVIHATFPATFPQDFAKGGGPGLRAAFPTHEIIGEESAAARAQQQLPPATLTVGDGGGSNGW